MEKITINASIDQDLNQVWGYWTQPRHITQWNFANDDWCCPKAENDMVVGGKYMARMEAKDGSFGFDFEAVYDEIATNEKITYTMTDGRQATTTFELKDGKTVVTTVFDPEAENSIDMQKQGWQAILNNFKAYAEKQN